MGDDIHNIRTTAEDLAIERAEQQFADPDALNMQFLQSTLNPSEVDDLSASTGFSTASVKGAVSSLFPSSNSFSGLSPAFSGAGLLGAVAAADMVSASSAMGMAAQVASAAPVAFGKSNVGESAVLAGLGNKALLDSAALSEAASPLKPVTNADGTVVPVSAEFTQLMAMLEGGGAGVNPDDALMSLIAGLGQNPSADNLQSAIDAVVDQIGLLNSTFDQIFDGLDSDVQSQVASQDGMTGTDLGLSIRDDAAAVSSTLTDLLGSVDVGSNPQLGSLLNLDSTFDGIASLVGSLPEVNLTPITTPVTDVVGDIVDGITDIPDPVTDVVTDIVTDIPDPVTDVVTDIVTDIPDPVVEVIDPVIDPILELIPDTGLLSSLSSSSSSESDGGLLGSLSSGISSTAGSEGGLLDGSLGPQDQNK